MKFRIIYTFQLFYKFYWFIITENNENLILFPCGDNSFFVKVDDFINLKILNNCEGFKATLFNNYQSLINIQKTRDIAHFPLNFINCVRDTYSYYEFIDKYY